MAFLIYPGGNDNEILVGDFVRYLFKGCLVKQDSPFSINLCLGSGYGIKASITDLFSAKYRRPSLSFFDNS